MCPLMRRARRALNACECVCRCAEPSAHHGDTPCNNRIMTVEIRASAGSMYSWRFEGSHPTQIRHAQLVPGPAPSSLPLCFFMCTPNPRAPPGCILPAAWASDSVLPGVMWPPRSEVLVGGEAQTVGPSDGTIWKSDLT